MSRKRHCIYLRLIDIPELKLSDEEKLAAVRRVVESLGEIEWNSPPSLHPRGGFVVQVSTAKEPDYSVWAETLNRAGFHNST